MSTSNQTRIPVPVLLGPTAVGKTGLALQVARSMGAEILSCDSRQIYRGMDIGTAKPSPQQLAQAKHWLVDILDPSQIYSAHQFVQDAQTIITERWQQGFPVLLVGGTGFYFQSLTQGLGLSAPTDEVFRQKCVQTIAQGGYESILGELQRVDPSSAARIHPSDKQRIIRALEIYHTTGTAASERKDFTHPSHNFDFFVVTAWLPRQDLYDRINARVDAMMQEGLWDEFCRLRTAGFRQDSPGLICVGYRELFDVELNRCSLQDAVEAIKYDTRRYAKRQMTWFRNKTPGHPFEVNTQNVRDLIDSYTRFIEGTRT